MTQEFRPRWSDGLHYRVRRICRRPASVTMEAADAFGLSRQWMVGRRLRFATFHFPGWEVLLDGRTLLPGYPSTGLGLLTADVPPGRHKIRVEWTARTRNVPALSSAWRLCWCWPAWPDFGTACWSCHGSRFCVGPVRGLRPPASACHTVTAGKSAAGLSTFSVIASSRWPSRPASLSILYVRSTPQPSAAYWQLLDGTGRVVAELLARRTSIRCPQITGQRQPDRRRLPLRPTARSSRRNLQARAARAAGGSATDEEPLAVGSVTLSAATRPIPGLPNR